MTARTVEQLMLARETVAGIERKLVLHNQFNRGRHGSVAGAKLWMDKRNDLVAERRLLRWLEDPHRKRRSR